MRYYVFYRYVFVATWSQSRDKSF